MYFLFIVDLLDKVGKRFAQFAVIAKSHGDAFDMTHQKVHAKEVKISGPYHCNSTPFMFDMKEGTEFTVATYKP